MSLKTEIQNAIVDPNQKLSDILRKAAILAHRLKSEEFKEWVDHELNGYEETDWDNVPPYRVLSTQSYGHFSGPFQSGLRDALIPTITLPDELHRFATTQPFHQGVRELEAMVESGRDGYNFQWPGDWVVAISKRVYERMVCMQAWKVITVDRIAGIVDTIRNRLLRFILEIEELDPDAGETQKSNSKIPPEILTQVFNTFITGSHNIVASGQNIKQTAHQSIQPGDFRALSETLAQLGLPKEDVADLYTAIEQDGERKEDDGFGARVRTWIGNTLRKIAVGTLNIALETAPLLITEAIKAYYGWS